MNTNNQTKEKQIKRVFNSILAILLVFTLCIPSVGLQAMSENVRAFADSVSSSDSYVEYTWEEDAPDGSEEYTEEYEDEEE